jgi:methylated-DNA-[protein]-cysteine S-methyltransferase
MGNSAVKREASGVRGASRTIPRASGRSPLAWRTLRTRDGWLALSGSPRGIRAIVLPHSTRRAAEAALRRVIRNHATVNSSILVTRDALRVTADRLLHRAGRELSEFLEGKRRRLAFPIDLSAGTTFQRRVWRAARAIPYGRVRSYRWVAMRLGGARYARAVGHALGANPVPLAVPCHRVLAHDGSLGGFSGGLAVKRRLLAFEGVKKSESRKVKSPRR